MLAEEARLSERRALPSLTARAQGDTEYQISFQAPKDQGLALDSPCDVEDRVDIGRLSDRA